MSADSIPDQLKYGASASVARVSVFLIFVLLELTLALTEIHSVLFSPHEVLWI